MVDVNKAREMWKFAEELGGWKKYGVVTKVARKFGVTTPTIYNMLRDYPKYPEKVYAEYRDFEEIKDEKGRLIVPLFRKLQGSTKVLHLRRFWLALGRKNPLNWGLEDYVTLHDHPNFRDPMIGEMTYDYLQSLRAFCRTFRKDLYDEFAKVGGILYTKGHSRPEGQRRDWFLTTSELTQFINAIDDIEMLAYVVLQVKTGARFSGLHHPSIKVKSFQITKERGRVTIFETKTGKPWIKFLDSDVVKVLREYVAVKGMKSEDKFFPHGYNWYNDRLKVYGTKAGLCKYKWVRVKYGKKRPRWSKKLKYVSGIPFSTHLFRHTFAFICAINNVSLEKTAEIGGWDDLVTLKNYYYYVPPEELEKVYYNINWSKDVPRDKMSLIDQRDKPPTKEELKLLEKEG